MECQQFCWYFCTKHEAYTIWIRIRMMNEIKETNQKIYSPLLTVVGTSHYTRYSSVLFIYFWVIYLKDMHTYAIRIWCELCIYSYILIFSTLSMVIKILFFPNVCICLNKIEIISFDRGKKYWWCSTLIHIQDKKECDGELWWNIQSVTPISFI